MGLNPKNSEREQKEDAVVLQLRTDATFGVVSACNTSSRGVFFCYSLYGAVKRKRNDCTVPQQCKWWCVQIMFAGTIAYSRLLKIVKDARLLKDITQLSTVGQTSSLESFHSLLLKFAPKSTAYTPKVMQARWVCIPQELKFVHNGSLISSSHDELNTCCLLIMSLMGCKLCVQKLIFSWTPLLEQKLLSYILMRMLTASMHTEKMGSWCTRGDLSKPKKALK